MHPGIPGDRGPSAIDWAILDGSERWGVTVLEAREELDGGPVWSSADFPMRGVSKSALYRRETTQAAVDAVMRAVVAAGQHGRPPVFQPNLPLGRERPSCRQADRRFDWTESTAHILRRIRSADSARHSIANRWRRGASVLRARRGTPGR